ncbi:MAG: aspartate kinase [Planctomycetota bacterium]
MGRMRRKILVQKFGGSSVATPERIRAAAMKAVRARRAGRGIVVVVSAMGDATDDLIALSEKVAENPQAREMDMLLSTGEQVSAALLAMAIEAMGRPAVSLTGAQVGIRTDSTHTKAKIRRIETRRIHRELDAGRIVVVAGFQGVDSAFDITTLGRGGSDATAVALAAALKAFRCDIYTDVDGVFTADPRLVPDACKLPRISYEELFELASVGAQIMQARSMELAMKFKVPLVVRSSLRSVPGTLVTEETKAMEDIAVIGAALERNEAKVTIAGVPDRPGVAGRIFGKLADAHINVDMIIQNVGSDGKADMTFTVGRTDLKKAMDITRSLRQAIRVGSVFADPDIAKVSVVGSGMKTHCGIAGKMFSALARDRINIEMISTSEIKISVIVRAKDGPRALRAVHKVFGLDRAVSRGGRQGGVS